MAAECDTPGTERPELQRPEPTPSAPLLYSTASSVLCGGSGTRQPCRFSKDTAPKGAEYRDCCYG